MNSNFLLRVRGLLRKEFLQIMRDPSAIAIAFLLPAILLMLFGYGVSLDARNVPLALVVEEPTPLAVDFASQFNHSPYFRPRWFANAQPAEAAMDAREVEGIVWLRNDFQRHAMRGGSTSIGVLVNGVDANNARLIEGYIQQIWIKWLRSQAAFAGHPAVLPVDLHPRVWFNPSVQSRDYLMPGLIGLIMTLTGALLTALVIAREWERGTMEALMATPLAIGEILFAKLIPYFMLGMGGMAASVAMAVFQFGVPLHGSLWILTLSSAIFLLATLGMGLLISTFARNQFVAGQIAITATFLPALILSGFIFDIGSMPKAIQIITYIVPARYFVAILQSLFLAGDIWAIIVPNVLGLLLMASIFLGAARLIARKRLD